jgi:hypothetical protein
LDNNALMKISVSQVIKVQCSAVNTAGEVAYDIYEFYLNDSPFLGNLTVSLVGEADNSTGTSVDSLWLINL